MIKTKNTMLAQVIASAVIFALLLLSIFIVIPVFRYLFILFIIVNIALGFINCRRNIPANIAFIVLTPSLFIPVLEYLTTIILVVLTGMHLFMVYRWYRSGGIEEVKDKKESKLKKKFHVPVWLIIVLVIGAIVFILLAIIALLFFSTTSMGG